MEALVKWRHTLSQGVRRHLTHHEPALMKASDHLEDMSQIVIPGSEQIPGWIRGGRRI
jgi:hypothetical protein